MTQRAMFWTVFTLTSILAAAPAWAQKGLGGGVGSQGKIGVGSDAHVDAPAVKAGAKTDVDASARSSARVKQPEDKGHGSSDFVTRIETNPKMSARVQALLPPGETLSQAATGFKNQGQFIAALHVSHNLNIPFDQLKASMTGSSAMSLGAAIKANRPAMTEVQAKEEAKKGEREAKQTDKS